MCQAVLKASVCITALPQQTTGRPVTHATLLWPVQSTQHDTPTAVSQDSPGKQPTGMCVRDSFKELPPLMGGPATLNLPETWEGRWGPSFGTLLSIGVSGAALPARTRRAPCLTAPGLAAAEVILMETSPPSDPASGST